MTGTVAELDRREIEKHAANLQQPGTSVTLEGGGHTATIEDPRGVCLEAASWVEERWPIELDALDPWPADEEGSDLEYVEAALAENVGHALTTRLFRLRHLQRFELGYLYRKKRTWEKKGRTVFGQCKRPTGLLKRYSDLDYIVLLNWDVWREMTPWQMVALVYHELRHTDPERKSTGHDFEGFFDELELFGTNTYREWARLARASEDGAGVKVQYHLPFAEEQGVARGGDAE